MRDNQFSDDKLYFEAEIKDVVGENVTLKRDLEGSIWNFHKAREFEYLIRVEQSANKGLVEENEKQNT